MTRPRGRHTPIDARASCRSDAGPSASRSTTCRPRAPAGAAGHRHLRQGEAASRACVDRTAVRNPLLISAARRRRISTSCCPDADIPPGVDVEIELNQRTAPWLLAHRERVQVHLSHLRVHQPSHEFLKDAVDNDVRDPKAFFAQLGFAGAGQRSAGVPGAATPSWPRRPRSCARTLFDPEDGPPRHPRAGARRTSSTAIGASRCAAAIVAVNARCDGAHINFLRDQGFAQLEPLRDGAWAEDAHGADAALAARAADAPARRAAARTGGAELAGLRAAASRRPSSR